MKILVEDPMKPCVRAKQRALEEREGKNCKQLIAAMLCYAFDKSLL